MRSKSENTINRTKAIHTLSKLPIFYGLEDQEYDDVLSICKVRELGEETDLFYEGDYSDAMYIVLSGELQVSKQDAGVLAVMKAGDLLGEMGVICQIPRTADVIALKDSVLLRIEKEALTFLLGKKPRISSIIMKNIAEVLVSRLINTAKKSQQYMT